jgi:hypothetical protein
MGAPGIEPVVSENGQRLPHLAYSRTGMKPELIVERVGHSLGAV